MIIKTENNNTKAVNQINNRLSLQIIILAILDNIGPNPWLMPPSRALKDNIIKLIAQIVWNIEPEICNITQEK